MEILQPKNMKRPAGFSPGIAAQGRTVFVAGQTGRMESGELAGPGFVEQARQALRNIVDILAAGGASPSHICRMTWFVVDMAEYVEARRELGRAYREIIGDTYPTMSVYGTTGLLDEKARLEIEVTAVVPG